MTLATSPSSIARQRRPHGHIAAAVGAVALAIALLTNVVVADSGSEQQLYAQCAAVYDAQACHCAVDAMPPAAAGSPPAAVQVAARSSASVVGRVESSRIPIQLTRDFVHLVQACMPRSRDTADD